MKQTTNFVRIEAADQNESIFSVEILITFQYSMLTLER